MIHPKQIAILTLENDIHALAIRKAFEQYDDIKCHIIETNRISDNANLCWSTIDTSSEISTSDGAYVNVKELDLIWWRRVNYNQKIFSQINEPAHIDLINNDCREALFGLLINEFLGTWINEPTATRLAENKLIQLKTAMNAGFRIPRTIVTQDPMKVRKFCSELKNNVVIKPVKGTLQYLLLTRMLRESDLVSDNAIRLCPAIYQECIRGSQHIRVHCFGDEIFAALIESKELDWRHNYNNPFSITCLSEEIKTRIRNILKYLDLKMGVIDLKIDESSSTPVWLEINPQGQFLFIEGLTGLDLTSQFVKFLYKEAKKAKMFGKGYKSHVP